METSGAERTQLGGSSGLTDQAQERRIAGREAEVAQFRRQIGALIAVAKNVAT
jgi:hypothetical protein